MRLITLNSKWDNPFRRAETALPVSLKQVVGLQTFEGLIQVLPGLFQVHRVFNALNRSRRHLTFRVTDNNHFTEDILSSVLLKLNYEVRNLHLGHIKLQIFDLSELNHIFTVHFQILKET